MASLLGKGKYGTLGGSLASPVTIYDRNADGGAAQLYSIANLDSANWANVQITYMHEGTSYFPILPGERIVFKQGANANNIQTIVGWGSTPSNAGAANVLIVGGIQGSN